MLFWCRRMDPKLTLLWLSVFGLAQSFECPRSNARGLFPNTEDCSKYYQCVDGGRYYEKNCPPGLWFDSRYSICNWPGYVSCYTERPQIQPLASGEEDPVLSGTIRRYPQQLGRQIHTTKKRPTYRTLSTTPLRRRFTKPVISLKTTKLATVVPPSTTEEQKASGSPQTLTTTTRVQSSTKTKPSTGSTTQSVLDWLYEDNLADEKTEPKVQNAHHKSTNDRNPINSVAALDEYGGFEEEDYTDTAFDPPPECSAAFSLELDPTRCEGFYQCYLWIPYPKVCPAGLLFDHRSNVCNWPEYVYCLDGERYDPPETTTPELPPTTPSTPPAPSNNFDFQNQYDFMDTNYDDYWPIEDVVEGERHQTAFKKKIIQADDSQSVGEQIASTPEVKTPVLMQKTSTPEVKTTALMKETESGDESTICGMDGCESEQIQTSDYKLHPKSSKKTTTSAKSNTYSASTLDKGTTAKSTSGFLSTVEKESKVKADSSKTSSEESADSTGSSSEGDNSNSSSFASSEEDKAGEGHHSSSEEIGGESSSEETNEVIKVDIKSDNGGIKENDIQVEIIEVKPREETKLPQEGSSAGYETTTYDSAPTSTGDSAPTTTLLQETTESPENDNSNPTPESNAQTSGNSTESEDSGTVVGSSKIDAMRNSMEKLITATKPTSSINTTADTTTESPRNSSIISFNDSIIAVEVNLTVTEATSTVQNNTNTNQTYLDTTKPDNDDPLISNKTGINVISAKEVNVTKGNETSQGKDETLSDSNSTSENSTQKDKVSQPVESDGAAQDLEVTALNETQSTNVTNSLDSVSRQNQTTNSTVTTKVPTTNVSTDTNSTTGNVTENTSNVTVYVPEAEANISSSDNHTEVSVKVNSTTEYFAVNETNSTTTSAPNSTECEPNACKTAKENNGDVKTNPASDADVAPASSKLETKEKARIPDIVMLSGKSPIARILEKLLNIRMKQIGNNQFKAIAATKQDTKQKSIPENKVKIKSGASASVPNKVSTTTLSSKTTSKLPPKKNITDNDTATIMENEATTKLVNETSDPVTEQPVASAANGTSLSDDVADGNVSLTTANTTEEAVNAEINTTTKATPLDLNNTTNSTDWSFDTTVKTNISVTTQQEVSTKKANEKINIVAAEKKKVGPDNSSVSINETKFETENTTFLTEDKNDTISNATVDSSTVLPTGTSDNESKSTNPSTEKTEKPINKEAGIDSNRTEATTTTGSSLNMTLSLNESDANRTTPQVTTQSTVNSNTTDEILANSTNLNITSAPHMNETNVSLSVNGSISTKQDVINDTTTVTKESKSNGTTQQKSTSTRTSRKVRETTKPIGKPTHFKSRENAPHFEARKVFGGPDDRWRFSDGTLVDQFSRQQRDVSSGNGTSAACQSISSMILMTFVVLLYHSLA